MMLHDVENVTIEVIVYFHSILLILILHDMCLVGILEIVNIKIRNYLIIQKIHKMDLIKIRSILYSCISSPLYL